MNRDSIGPLAATVASLCLLLADPPTLWAQEAAAGDSAFTLDDRRMRQFEWYIGEWGPPPGGDPPQYSITYEWGLPGKTVRISEHRVIDGEKVKVQDGLIGYHYGRQRIEYIEFMRDGTAPFEVMYAGTYRFRPHGIGAIMVREFRAYDPDTSSRAYRETHVPIDDNTRRLTIEYLDDDGEWREWRVFTAVRRP